MNRFKEAQCSVQTENADSKVHGNFKLVQVGKPGYVHDSGTALTVFIEAFAEKKEKNISFKAMFLHHATNQQQQKPNITRNPSHIASRIPHVNQIELKKWLPDVIKKCMGSKIKSQVLPV